MKLVVPCAVSADPDPTELAELINTEFAEVVSSHRTTVTCAIHLGELFERAKSKCKHGEWLSWLAANCPNVSTRSAQAWMQLTIYCRADSDYSTKLQARTLQEVLARCAKPKCADTAHLECDRNIGDEPVRMIGKAPTAPEKVGTRPRNSAPDLRRVMKSTITDLDDSIDVALSLINNDLDRNSLDVSLAAYEALVGSCEGVAA